MADERSQRTAFGALLRARRVAAGFTQDQLAERARISVQAVSALERGARHAPRGETLALLTRALDLEGDAFVEFEAAAKASVKPKVRASQPLLKPPSRKRAQLPQFATPFIGRDRDVQRLASAVLGGGCTTLWGTGGVGKTRLAAETSALVEDRFERIAFVGLAATIGDDAVDDAIASALGVTLSPGEDVYARLVRELSEAHCLVIVDNCEHVVAGAARAVDALATALPGAAFVCTSREPLRIAGERVIGVGPLDAGDARRLFVGRAETLAPEGVLSASDERDVATICRKLDGIPLALELAAACVRVLDLEHVANGLDERFRLLTFGSRAATDRHTTLRATIAWSYDMLGARERHVFESAAIVNGTFLLDDVLAIAVDERCDRAAVLAAIAELVAKALVVSEIDAETSRRRYRLLDSMRAFALETAGERVGDGTLEAGYRRFGAYLAARLRHANERYRAGDGEPMRRIDLDHVRGYLDWAVEKGGDVAAGTRLAGENHLAFDFFGLHAEGIRWAQAGLARLPEDESEGVAAMHASYAISRLGQRLIKLADSLEPAMRAYALAVRNGDDAIRASAAAKIAVAYDAMGQRQGALAYANESIACFERIGDSHSAAYTACVAAIVAFKIRGDDAALENVRLAVERQRRLGDDRRTASAELDLGEAYFAGGNVDAAVATVRSAIEHFRANASRLELAIALNNLAVYEVQRERLAEAAAAAAEALRIGRDGEYQRMVVLAAQSCAIIAARAGRELGSAARLFGYAARRYETIGEIGFTEALAHARLREALATKLDADELAGGICAGSSLGDDDAFEAALCCIEYGEFAR